MLSSATNLDGVHVGWSSCYRTELIADDMQDASSHCLRSLLLLRMCMYSATDRFLIWYPLSQSVPPLAFAREKFGNSFRFSATTFSVLTLRRFGQARYQEPTVVNQRRKKVDGWLFCDW